jgi:hypothetical protein
MEQPWTSLTLTIEILNATEEQIEELLELTRDDIEGSLEPDPKSSAEIVSVKITQIQ